MSNPTFWICQTNVKSMNPTFWICQIRVTGHPTPGSDLYLCMENHTCNLVDDKIPKLC